MCNSLQSATCNSSIEVGTGSVEIGSRNCELVNFDGSTVRVSLDRCAGAIAKFYDHREGSIEAVKVEQGILIRIPEASPYIVADSGMVYRCSTYRHVQGEIPCTFDSNRVLLDKEGDPLTPCARMIVVGNGHVVCAPPGIHKAAPKAPQSHEPHSIGEVVADLAERAISRLAALIHAGHSNEIVAECSWSTKQWVFLRDVGTGGASGPKDESERDVVVKASVTTEGELSFSESLDNNDKKELFPWEQAATQVMVTEQWEFDELTGKATT
jgi:hypothetical protein